MACGGDDTANGDGPPYRGLGLKDGVGEGDGDDAMMDGL
jgi:hypothetical protein